MTFQFLIFSITIKKRQYSQRELQQFLLEEELNKKRVDNEIKMLMFRQTFL